MLFLALLRKPKVIANLNENWTQVAPDWLDIDSEAINKDIMPILIREFYFKDQPISNKTEKQLIDLMSDRTWNHATYLSAVLQSINYPDSVYLYYLSKPPAKGYARKFVDDYIESEHGGKTLFDSYHAFYTYKNSSITILYF